MLSGAPPAGVNGLRAVTDAGGVTMARNVASASYAEMPVAAIDFGKASVIIMAPSRMAQALLVLAQRWGELGKAA